MGTGKHDGMELQFRHLSRSWYGATCLATGDVDDVITIGFYDPQGGTTGEFQIEWAQLGGKSVPRLSVYQDGWSALASIPGLIEALEGLDGTLPTPEHVCNMLLSIGVEDATEETENVDVR